MDDHLKRRIQEYVNNAYLAALQKSRRETAQKIQATTASCLAWVAPFTHASRLCETSRFPFRSNRCIDSGLCVEQFSTLAIPCRFQFSNLLLDGKFLCRCSGDLSGSPCLPDCLSSSFNSCSSPTGDRPTSGRARPVHFLAICMMLSIAGIAAFLPARRAMRVDPWSPFDPNNPNRTQCPSNADDVILRLHKDCCKIPHFNADRAGA
jgi:hypothetical protein